MKIQDLGDLDGQILLCGGPYSNLHAARAFLERQQDLGIPASHVICTGDIAAYCADPFDTIDLVQRSGWAVVAGNCEKQLAAGAQDCGCGFEDGTACDLLSGSWFAHATQQVSAAQRGWMDDLPDLIIFTHAARRFAVIHGGASEISRFIWSVSDDVVFKEEIEMIEHHIGAVDAVIAGHSGIAFSKQVDGIEWINAGALGMPAHSGQPTTQFARLDQGDLHFETLTYDVGGATKAMQAQGLVQGYDKALQSGYWPSEDVLPEALKRSN